MAVLSTPPIYPATPRGYRIYYGDYSKIRSILAAMVNDTSANPGNWFSGNPINSLLDVRIYPVLVNQHGTHNSATVKLGAFNTQVTCDYMVEGSEHTSNTITVPAATDFTDLEPVTEIKLFLPFIGYMDLAPSSVVGKTVTVDYFTDWSTGEITAYIFAGSDLLRSASGQLGLSIPVTSSNITEIVRSRVTAGISAFASIGLAAATKNPLPLAGLVSSGISVATQTQNTSVSSAFSGAWGDFANPLAPYILKIKRNVVSVGTTYRELNGVPSGATAAMSTLTGYTEVEYVHVENINCYPEEAQMIEDLLKSGVIF